MEYKSISMNKIVANKQWLGEYNLKNMSMGATKLLD